MAFLTRSLSFMKKKKKYDPISEQADYFTTPERRHPLRETQVVNKTDKSSTLPTLSRKVSMTSAKDAFAKFTQKVKGGAIKRRNRLDDILSPCTPRRRSTRLAGKQSPLELRLYSPFCIQTPNHVKQAQISVEPDRAGPTPSRRPVSSRSCRPSMKEAGKENMDTREKVEAQLNYHRKLAGEFSLTYENMDTGTPL